MSGKVHGQKLFKTKSGHGLLVPVQFVRLLTDYEDGRNIFPVASRSNSSSPSASSHVHRTQSVPNFGVANNRVPLEEYIPLTLSGLKIGDNAVWLGSTPQTGIVRWIGKV